MSGKKKTTMVIAPSIPAGLEPHVPADYEIEDRHLFENTIFTDCRIDNQNAHKVCFDKVVFRNVIFSATSLSNAEFLDVVFENCDLSNVDFTEAALHRVSMVNCKLLGTDFTDSVWRDVSLEQCNASYAVLRFNDWKRVLIRSSTLANTDCFQSSWTHITLQEVVLEAAQLSRTKLAGVDLSSCEFYDLSVSGEDLQGAIIDPSQAGLFARIFGLVIKE